MLELALLINMARVNPVQIDPILTERAEWRAEALCANGQFSHDGLQEYTKGLPYKWAGENLYRGSGSYAKMHNKFMKSPLHKWNIVDPKWKAVGIGETNCKGKKLVVELFAG